MATESVATGQISTKAASSYPHDVWIGRDDVLSIGISRNPQGFPAVVEHCDRLNDMIQGLARAAKSVVYQLENDDKADPSFVAQPVESLMEAIILLSQLSTAVQHECRSA